MFYNIALFIILKFYYIIYTLLNYNIMIQTCSTQVEAWALETQTRACLSFGRSTWFGRLRKV